MIIEHPEDFAWVMWESEVWCEMVQEITWGWAWKKFQVRRTAHITAMDMIARYGPGKALWKASILARFKATPGCYGNSFWLEVVTWVRHETNQGGVTC